MRWPSSSRSLRHAIPNMFPEIRCGHSSCEFLSRLVEYECSDLLQCSAGFRDQAIAHLPYVKQPGILAQRAVHPALPGFLVQPNGLIKQELTGAGLDQQRRQAMQVSE